jgi:hypothetical protein
LSCAELMRRFYHPDEKHKLAYVRQLAENYWAGAYNKQEMFAIEDFLQSFIDTGHALHESHQRYLLGYSYLPKRKKQEIIGQAEIMVFSFLTCSEVSPDCRRFLDEIKLNPPGPHFLLDVALVIKYAKLDRPAAD